jgi:heavy metal translocating P-type ATPase
VCSSDLRKVRLAGGDRERWVSPEAVQPGDLFSVIQDERIPLDGRVLSGRGRLDESILTGESKPVRKKTGDDVSAGTLLLEGDLTLTATRTGRESALRRMIDALEKALLAKNRFETLSERLLKGFVPGLMGLAFGTFLFLRISGTTWEEALLRAVTVLVISCPCALGIASPLAKAAALGTGRRRGILVRDPAGLEQASEIDTIVIDKTGTLTRGDFTLLDTVTSGCTGEEALARVAAVEQFSDHFLGREIVRRAGRLPASPATVTDFEAFEGRGARAVVDDVDVAVGNRSLMNLRQLFLPDALNGQGRLQEDRGHTVAFFGWEGRARGFFVFGDSLREGAGKAVKEIQEEGIAVWLVSGDAEGTTRAVAEACGVERFIGQVLPEAKADLVRRLQEEGHTVAMAGDGLNDAAALAQADVGIAIETGLNLSREAAGIVLLNPDPGRFVEILRLSRLTRKTIRQNLLFAFLYNGLAIPLAVSGALNPLIAALAMVMSSLSVIGNTLRNLRLSRFEPRLGKYK